MLQVVLLEILIGGSEAQFDQVLGDLLQFLHQHAADHRLVPVQTHGERFPMQRDLPDLGVDQTVQFLRRRGAVPTRAPSGVQAGDVGRRDPNRRLVFLDTFACHPVQRESEERTEHDELDQGLSDQTCDELGQNGFLLQGYAAEFRGSE